MSLVLLCLYPNTARCVRRLELKFDGLQVAAKVYVARALGCQLSLSTAVALKAALPGSKTSSKLEWLRSCHLHLHGESCQSLAALVR